MRQICKFCKSEIDGDCYKCPVCREWLHPFRLRKDNPLLKRTLYLVLFFLVIMFVPRLIATKYLSDRFTYKEFQSAEKHGLKIVSHKVRKEKEKIVILGELKNEGLDSFSSLEVEADFYDKKNNLINIESGHLSGGLEPGKTRPFQVINCCGKDNLNDGFVEFDHYELMIVNGTIKQVKHD